MKYRYLLTINTILILLFIVPSSVYSGPHDVLLPGYKERIENYVDSLAVFDTHEHLFNPESLKDTYFLDFSLLLHQNNWDDLVSSGMPNSVYNQVFNQPLTAIQKWKIIKPFWEKTFNTSSSRITLRALKDLYDVDGLSDSTVEVLSSKIKKAYEGDWFNHVLKDLCKIDNVIQETDFIGADRPFINYTDKFTDWIIVNRRFSIDSLSVARLEPVNNLEDYVKSMSIEFEEAIKMGMVAVKVNVAYNRSLSFNKVSAEAAGKVFNMIKNGNETHKISMAEAKPLQDYMLRKLLDMAGRYRLPIAFHTGLQAGSGNILENSNPALLSNLFLDYPGLKFVLYHGSYPFGGILSSLAKTFPNVYLDMSWVYAISPAYARQYLNEWLESVPASKIMAFGGDQRCVENTYGQLMIAKQIITEVLTEKVKEGYLTETEAMTVARMILHDNGMRFYNIKNINPVTPL
jgi:predicted TIM-barrel fold metal-dependent hydrolase